MFTDTHIHFDLLEDADGAVARAFEAGLAKMVAVGGSKEGNDFAVDLALKYPERIAAAVGFDRGQAGHDLNFVEFESFAMANHVAAIGEVGLDYHYHPDTAVAQKVLLREMLATACRLNLPVIVHTREADDDTLELLGERSGLRGVIHCFTGNRSFAEKLVALGFCISFSGIVTFKKAVQVREAAEVVPDDRLLMETDSPFLAPEPYRGKKNEPAYVKRVAEVLAGIRGCSVEHVAAITTANAVRLFGL